MRMNPRGSVFLVDKECHPQTIKLVRTRVQPLGMAVELGSINDFLPVELDCFCDAMLSIHDEIEKISKVTEDGGDNLLKNAPNISEMMIADEWSYPFSREKAAFLVLRLRRHEFWPLVGRVDNIYGDRNLVQICDSIKVYAQS